MSALQKLPMWAVLLLAAGGSVTARASVSRANAPARASLRVDASALTSDGERLAEALKVAGEAALRAEDVLPRRGKDGASLIVRIKPALPSSYAWSLSISPGSENGQPREGTCEACSEPELEAEVVAAIRAVAAELEPPPRAAVEPAVPVPDRGPPPPASRRSPRLTAVGKLGIGLLAPGVASLVTGVIFVVRDRTVESLPGSMQQHGRDFNFPGVLMLGVGGAAAVAGAILIVADRARLRRSRFPMLAPHAAQTSLGLMWSSRF